MAHRSSKPTAPQRLQKPPGSVSGEGGGGAPHMPSPLRKAIGMPLPGATPPLCPTGFEAPRLSPAHTIVPFRLRHAALRYVPAGG